AGVCDFGWLGMRRLRATCDPALDQRHLFRRELFAALGHFALVNHLEEQTLLRFAGDDHWSIVAALEHQSAQSQIDPTSQLVTLAMAIETMRLEDRPNLFLEGGWSGGKGDRAKS